MTQQPQNHQPQHHRPSAGSPAIPAPFGSQPTPPPFGSRSVPAPGHQPQENEVDASAVSVPRLPQHERVEPNPDLPSMADLDRLQTKLDNVDQTLAALNDTA